MDNFRIFKNIRLQEEIIRVQEEIIRVQKEIFKICELCKLTFPTPQLAYASYKLCMTVLSRPAG